MGRADLEENASREAVLLLVEDDEGHAELVKLNLRDAGINNELIHFNDGDAVIEYFSNSDAATAGRKYLMILDLNMPGTNGIEVLRMFKNHDSTKSIPVIVLTTTDDDESAEACYKLGCNAFITKAVDYDAFSKAVKDLGAFIKVAKLSATKKEETVYVSY